MARGLIHVKCCDCLTNQLFTIHWSSTSLYLIWLKINKAENGSRAKKLIKTMARRSGLRGIVQSINGIIHHRSLHSLSPAADARCQWSKGVDAREYHYRFISRVAHPGRKTKFWVRYRTNELSEIKHTPWQSAPWWPPPWCRHWPPGPWLLPFPSPFYPVSGKWKHTCWNVHKKKKEKAARLPSCSDSLDQASPTFLNLTAALFLLIRVHRVHLNFSRVHVY